jgi:hypothetical protein
LTATSEFGNSTAKTATSIRPAKRTTMRSSGR